MLLFQLRAIIARDARPAADRTLWAAVSELRICGHPTTLSTGAGRAVVDQEVWSMIRQMTGELQQCVDTCEQCHRMCEEMMTRCMETGGEQMRRTGMMLMSCADICRMSADMMTRCWAIEGESDMCRISMKILEMCADMCDMGADMCRSVGSSEMNNCADMMARCAQMCRKMTPKAMQPA
jgi:hypothetical protein